MDRIIEVAFSENADLDAAVAANNGVIAAYATRRERPEFPDEYRDLGDHVPTLGRIRHVEGAAVWRSAH